MLLPLLFALTSTAVAYNYNSQGLDWTGNCSSGVEQSPINLVQSSSTVDSDESLYLELNVEKADGTGGFTADSYKVEGTFGSVVAKSNSTEDTLTIGSFHFHAPSEHTIDDSNHDLEMHSILTDSNGQRYGVIGILFKTGSSNDFIQDVIDGNGTTSSIDYPEAFNGITAMKNFWYYKGSLTTPDCDEGLNWHVWADVQELSSEQLKFFTDAWAGDNSFGAGNGNNRLVQPLNSRTLTYYDSSDEGSAAGLLLVGLFWLLV